MADSIIVCPKCKEIIPLTSAIEGPIAARLREQFEAANRVKEAALAEREKALGAARGALEKQKERQEQELAERLAGERKKLAEEAKQKAEAQLAVDMGDLRNQVTEQGKKLQAAQATELELRKQRRELEEQKATLARSFEEQVAQRVKVEGARLSAEALRQAKDSQAAELGDLQARLADREQKLQEAQRQELELRKGRRELEEKRQAFELESARTMDAEREKIRAAAAKAADEAHRLKEQEAQQQMAAMRRQIDELKQKAEQGSQQLQGEVLELELEGMLRAAFPHDQVIPVAKGVHGGDVIHRVMAQGVQHCGTILWESKRTKTWSDGWIAKLKDDQRAAKADVAVIVSIAMPRDVTHMAQVDGVWVTSRECMLGMVAALRSGLVRLAETKRAAEGKHEKMDMLYQYVSGHEFQQRVEAIIETFKALREDLEQEKRAMTKIWAKREKQLERVTLSTTGMHGDFAGIIGASLPAIETMELPKLAAAKAADE